MSEAPGSMAEQIGPPVAVLVLAAVAVVGSIVLLASVSLAAHVVGYVLGSFVCIGLVAAFARLDAGRRSHPARRYEERPGQRERLLRACTAALTLGFVSTAVHVWYVARELAVG